MVKLLLRESWLQGRKWMIREAGGGACLELAAFVLGKDDKY